MDRQKKEREEEREKERERHDGRINREIMT
jgi:hypothetical protein